MTHTSELFDSIDWNDARDYMYRDEHGFLLTKSSLFSGGVDLLFWDPLHLVLTAAKRLLGDVGRFLLRRYSESTVKKFIARIVKTFGIHCWAGIDGSWVTFGCKRAGRAAGLAMHIEAKDGGLCGEPGDVLPADDPDAHDIVIEINYVFGLFAKTSQCILTLDQGEFEEGLETYQLDALALNSAIMAFFGDRNMTPTLSYRCDVLPYFMKKCKEWGITLRELAMDGAEESHKLRTEYFDMLGRFMQTGRKADAEVQQRKGYYEAMLRVMVKMAHDFIERVETTAGKNSEDTCRIAEKRDAYVREKTGGSVHFTAIIRYILNARRREADAADGAGLATSGAAAVVNNAATMSSSSSSSSAAASLLSASAASSSSSSSSSSSALSSSSSSFIPRMCVTCSWYAAGMLLYGTTASISCTNTSLSDAGKSTIYNECIASTSKEYSTGALVALVLLQLTVYLKGLNVMASISSSSSAAL